MLETLGYPSLEALIDAVVPRSIVSPQPIPGWPARAEHEALLELRAMAGQNWIWRSYLGAGYHDCVTPSPILRNILENPGWYTPYTPYQAEISQGRLEALLNFQTMVIELTGMEVANASLLDEGTAAAEAMAMSFAMRKDESARKYLVSKGCHPQTIDLVRTRAKPLGIEIETLEHPLFQFDASVFGALVQYPNTDGTVHDFRSLCEKAHAAGAVMTVAADILALTLLTPPGEFGADIAVGSTQRFGVPLGFGGPHAAYFATKDAFKRQMPGRIVGVSKDGRGRPALRLALQTREQHIRREKATSNICTAQVLLAVMASMYGVYHGPDGLKEIARRVHRHACLLAEGLKKLGHWVPKERFFDTVRVDLGPGTLNMILDAAKERKINLRVFDKKTVVIALDETVTSRDVKDLLEIFALGRPLPFAVEDLEIDDRFEPPFERHSGFLGHEVFHRYRSETEFMRYLRHLQSKDIGLTDSMVPLGSCTMKLNAASEMLPVTWPEFARMHPFVPKDQAEGYRAMIQQLELRLAELTGFAAMSLMPNAGSQGEYAGLLVIRAYHESHRQGERDVCLIPHSAHGTNPASAAMAGLRVVVVECDENGNINVADLKAKAKEHEDKLAALMVTYPSTHGVFEESIREIIDVVHAHGGQVYMDGANLNALIGLCRPGDIGVDVSHLNLHKTFCIPHGGGGPGMGPIGVRKHLAPFLPRHPIVETGGGKGIGAVSAAPWGSAGILPIPWMYLEMMGSDGLAQATRVAILNANYIAKRLEPHYPILYKGKRGLVAHECILDLRGFKDFDVQVEDMAKRLMDYGFHAPTVSWPVPGTLMVEPTESESKAELDRFCEAMILIRQEIAEVQSGKADKKDNVLKNAPHTADQVAADEWKHPYAREKAAFPAPWSREHKYWPSVSRVDGAYGDRNFVCSCAPLESYL